MAHLYVLAYNPRSWTQHDPLSLYTCTYTPPARQKKNSTTLSCCAFLYRKRFFGPLRMFLGSKGPQLAIYTSTFQAGNSTEFMPSACTWVTLARKRLNSTSHNLNNPNASQQINAQSQFKFSLFKQNDLQRWKQSVFLNMFCIDQLFSAFVKQTKKWIEMAAFWVIEVTFVKRRTCSAVRIAFCAPIRFLWRKHGEGVFLFRKGKNWKIWRKVQTQFTHVLLGEMFHTGTSHLIRIWTIRIPG